MNYLIVDTANTFFRARHAAHRASTLEEKVWTAQKTIRNSVYERNYADIKEAIARTFKALDE